MRLSTRCFIAHDAIFEGGVKGGGGEKKKDVVEAERRRIDSSGSNSM